MNEMQIKKAPDGGWGWFACLGSGLITVIGMITELKSSLRSLDPSFGLIFNELLENLKVDSTKMSSVLSVLDACSNFSGIFVGPLLKKFSFRTVAAFGSFLSCTGLFLTAFANSIGYILFTYSILTGIGTGLAVAAAFVALNNYFDKRRGVAVSFSSAFTALAMMIVPQAAHLLLDRYSFQGTMLIFSALAMHSLVGACLLRPLNITTSDESKIQVITSKSLDEKTEEETSLINSNNHKDKTSGLVTMQSNKNDSKSDKTVENNKERKQNDFLNTLIALFDIDLLKNYSYLNVIFGLSLYNVAEANFKLMTPFFLRKSVGLTDVEIAFCLSLSAFTDIAARILLPIIYDRLGFKKRRLFWINAFFVAVGRSIFAEHSKGIGLYIILFINGFIRGAAIQNLLLSISETCSIKKLPNAIGLFMVSKGLFSLTLSPLVGFIRDYSGSYRVCLHSMNVLILICFINWSIEFSWNSFRRKESKQIISSVSL